MLTTVQLLLFFLATSILSQILCHTYTPFLDHHGVLLVKGISGWRYNKWELCQWLASNDYRTNTAILMELSPNWLIPCMERLSPV
jgi:hypothetical protein